MNSNFLNYKHLIISKSASKLKYGIQIISVFLSKQVPVYIVEENIDVLKHPLANNPLSLLVQVVPPIGWIKRAEHGTLFTRSGEHYLYPIIGCQFKCVYCYLQATSHSRQPLKLYIGINDLFKTLHNYLRNYNSSKELIFCSGELADSLTETQVYPVTIQLIKYFAKCDKARLELRTKSNNVNSLLDLNHHGRTTVSFSINPNKHIQNFEIGTASLEERLLAARSCQNNGYPVALKFEPIILSNNWSQLYDDTIKDIVNKIDIDSLHHISIGSLRWSDKLCITSDLINKMNLHSKLFDRIMYRCNKFNNTINTKERIIAYRWFRQKLRIYGFKAPIIWSLETPEVISCLGES